MATVSPIQDAGSVQFTETFTRYYSSPGSLIVIASDPDLAVLSAASIGLSGERAFSAFSGHQVRGNPPAPSLGASDSGVIPDNVALGALDEGAVLHDPALDAFELQGEGADEALSILDTQAENSITGAIEYLSYGSLEAKSESLAAGIGSADISGESRDTSRSAFAVRERRLTASRAVLEAASDKAGYPASSSLETGTPTEATSRASADVLAGEGVDFMVDIQDEILSSGHGDC